MRQIGTILLALAVALPVAMAQTQPAIGPAGPVRSREVTEAVRVQTDARRQLLDLIQSMHDVSRELEKSDPAAARAVEVAVQKAEEAFIADDMQMVVRLLQQGLVAPADAKQNQVIERLRSVLETLRSGGDDLEARLVQLEKLRQLIEDIKQLLAREKELERQSRLVMSGPTLLKDLAAARAGVARLDARQAELLKRTEALTLDATALQISAASQTVQELLHRQDDLQKAMADPYPSPDKMASYIAGARGLAAEATTVRITIKATLNDAAVARQLKDANATADGEAVESQLVKAMDELARGAKSLEADSLEDGQVAIAEAGGRVNNALEALDTVMSKLPTSKPLVALIAEEQALIDQLNAAADLVDDLAPATDADQQPEEASHSLNKWRKEKPTTRPGLSTTRPAAHQPAAVLALRRADRQTAAAEQGRIRLAVGTHLDRLDALTRNVESLRTDPQFPRQQAEQEDVAAALARASRGEATTRPVSSQPATAPPLSVVPNEQLAALSQASARASEAAVQLAALQAAPANAREREAIRILEETLASLQSLFEGFAQVVQGEFKDRWLATLERVVIMQKRCSADTIDLFTKRPADGVYKRSEQLGLVAVANAQGDILVHLGLMEKMMGEAVSAHHVVTFPPVVPLMLSLVKQNVATAKERLIASDAGPETQAVQKRTEALLEGMLKAMGGQNSNKPETPPSWGQNKPGTPDNSKTDRTAELQLVQVLQGQINARVEELDRLRHSGKAVAASVDVELKKIAGLQGDVHRMIESMLLEDQLRETSPRRQP